MHFTINKTMFVVCYISFIKEHKTLTKLIKDDFPTHVSDGDTVYSTEDKDHYEDRIAYNDLETALEYCNKDTDFSDPFFEYNELLIISEKFGLNLIGEDNDTDDIVTKTVSDAFQLSPDDVDGFIRILNAVPLEDDVKIELIRDETNMFHIEANGQIRCYKNDYTFDNFVTDLQFHSHDSFDHLVITELCDKKPLGYILIAENGYKLADYNDLINLAFKHFDELE